MTEPLFPPTPAELEVRELRRRGEALSRLSKLPEFTEVLAARVKEEDQRIERAIVDHVLSGDPLDQRRVDHARGFRAGLKFPFATVDGAVRKLAGDDLAEEEEDEHVDIWRAWE